ncbi:Fe(3+) ABC transporter substrate-binding protein [Alteromonadaceae bacterium M269]|nr:Fe(3+) ABC transporter substrate-binding protein [Alteromonadaceae bacterium M269]
MFKRRLRVITAVALAISSISISAMADEVNVYSARKEALIKPILDQFSEQSGIKVNLITGKADALISRMKTEGKFSPADVLVTTDVGRLHRAKSQGLLQPISSDVLEASISANLRDGNGEWFALTKRARPIMYVPERVNASELSSVDELADEKWKGRVCIRSSSNIYNQSMVASLIEQQGSRKTQAWLNNFVKSFARPPKGGDRDQIKAAVAGVCDIAIANSYYLAGMLVSNDESEREVAKKVKVFWPSQDGRGAHVNISGAGVAKHAPNADAAKKLIEFMVTKQAQEWYAKHNQEYPVIDGVDWSPELLGFGEFKGENVRLQRLGELNADAVKLMDKAGWR